MKLTIRFGDMSTREKLSFEERGQNFGLRIFRTGQEVILEAEGPYDEMLKIIDMTSYLKHKELILRQ